MPPRHDNPSIPGPIERHARQRRLPQIKAEGQSRLASARVLIVGCGALGTVQAELLARAGVGHLTLADRDVVELSNLQRQLLFDEEDALHGRPKAEAAAARLRAIDSGLSVTSLVTELNAGNLPALVREHDLVLDATDNPETRYTLNDVCVEAGATWLYGGAVGTSGLMMAVRPGAGPCLRCVFPEPPTPGSLPTCEFSGVLGTATAMVATLQANEAIRLLIGQRDRPSAREGVPDATVQGDDHAVLWSIEVWPPRFSSVTVPRDPDCPACGHRRFEFLRPDSGTRATTLCGRGAVQVSAPPGTLIDLESIAARLRELGTVQTASASLLRFVRDDAGDGADLLVFADGRVVVKGTDDPSRARSLVSRYIGY